MPACVLSSRSAPLFSTAGGSRFQWRCPLSPKAVKAKVKPPDRRLRRPSHSKKLMRNGRPTRTTRSRSVISPISRPLTREAMRVARARLRPQQSLLRGRSSQPNLAARQIRAGPDDPGRVGRAYSPLPSLLHPHPCPAPLSSMNSTPALSRLMSAAFQDDLGRWPMVNPLREPAMTRLSRERKIV
jgi:hypothetical protein